MLSRLPVPPEALAAVTSPKVRASVVGGFTLGQSTSIAQGT